MPGWDTGEVPFGPRRSITSTELLELDGVSMRAGVFRFDVLDRAHTKIGELDVDRNRPPKVRNDTTRTIKRTLDGLTVDPVSAAELDTIRARIRPVFVLEDGSEWPLGVFLFVDASDTLLRAGDELSGSLHDELFMLDQAIDETVSYRKGTNLADVIEDQALAAGFVHLSIDTTGLTARSPLAWPAGTKRLKIVEDVATMAAFYSPYVSNDGVFTVRAIPADVDLGDITLVYELGGRIIADSAVESDDLLEAANVFLVLDDASTDAPTVGRYELPSSSPVSIARRGFAVASVRTMQGLTNPDAANEAARADALNTGLGFEAVTFDAVPDYRHDTYDDITYAGEVWRELAWETECSPLAVMRHEARKAYS